MPFASIVTGATLLAVTSAKLVKLSVVPAAASASRLDTRGGVVSVSTVIAASPVSSTALARSRVLGAAAPPVSAKPPSEEVTNSVPPPEGPVTSPMPANSTTGLLAVPNVTVFSPAPSGLAGKAWIVGAALGSGAPVMEIVAQYCGAVPPHAAVCSAPTSSESPLVP